LPATAARVALVAALRSIEPAASIAMSEVDATLTPPIVVSVAG
jgi:hypothetical protein